MFLLSLKKRARLYIKQMKLDVLFFCFLQNGNNLETSFFCRCRLLLCLICLYKNWKLIRKITKKRLTGLKSEVVVTWSRPQSEARTDAGSFSRQLLLTLDDWARFGYGLSLNRAANTAQPVPNFLSLFHQKHVRKSWSIRSSSSAFKYGVKCAHLLSAR